MKFSQYSIIQFCEEVYDLFESPFGRTQISSVEMYQFIKEKSNDFDLKCFEYLILDIRNFQDSIQFHVKNPEPMPEIEIDQDTGYPSWENEQLREDYKPYLKYHLASVVLFIEFDIDLRFTDNQTLRERVELFKKALPKASIIHDISNLLKFSDIAEKEYARICQPHIDTKEKELASNVETISIVKKLESNYYSLTPTNFCWLLYPRKSDNPIYVHSQGTFWDKNTEDVTEHVMYKYIKHATDNFSLKSFEYFIADIRNFAYYMNFHVPVDYVDGTPKETFDDFEVGYWGNILINPDTYFDVLNTQPEFSLVTIQKWNGSNSKQRNLRFDPKKSLRERIDLIMDLIPVATFRVGWDLLLQFSDVAETEYDKIKLLSDLDNEVKTQEVSKDKITETNFHSSNAPRKSTLSLIKNGTYSQNFPNNMEGGFEYNTSDSSYRFIEMTDDLHNLKYLERELTLENTPIRAIGIVAYVIRNYGTAAVEIYSTYFNSLEKQYIEVESKKPDAFKRNLKQEFLKKHIIEEKQRVAFSKDIFEFISEGERAEILNFANNYFDFINQNNNPIIEKPVQIVPQNLIPHLSNDIKSTLTNINKDNFIELIREIGKQMPDTEIRREFLENRFIGMGYSIETGYKQTSYFYNEIKKARDGQESIYKGKLIKTDTTFALVDDYTCYLKIYFETFEKFEELFNKPQNTKQIQINKKLNEVSPQNNKTPNNIQTEATLSHAHIALICFYQGIAINKQNGDEILSKYNGTGGQRKLIEKYNLYLKRESRVFCDESKADLIKQKRLIEVIEFLTKNNLNSDRATKDLEELQKNMNI